MKKFFTSRKGKNASYIAAFSLTLLLPLSFLFAFSMESGGPFKTSSEDAEPSIKTATALMDSDGDGVDDSTDTDDDNDGIYDADECFNCTADFNADLATKQSIIVSSTANVDADNGGSIRDVLNTVVDEARFFFPGTQQVAGLEYFRIEFPKPITLQGIEIAVGAWLFSNGAVLNVDGSNDASNWTTLLTSTRTGSAATGCSYGDCTGDDSEQFEFLTNTTAYKFYRIIGVGSGTSRQFPYVTELFFLVNTSMDEDLDLDGVPNRLDLDSDNDGIPDNVEAQPTLTYVAPNGDAASNGGVDSAYPSSLAQVNTDGDVCPDWVDEDSDNDGTPDRDESGLTFNGVPGMNGLDSGSETADNYTDVNGIIDDPDTDLASDGAGSEAYYRQSPGPGGVGIGLALWLKADVEVTPGATFTWADQAGMNDATQTSATRQPIYVTSGDRLVNFNPTLDFDGSNDYLRNADGGLHTNEIFVVGSPDAELNSSANGDAYLGWLGNFNHFFGTGSLTSSLSNEVVSFGLQSGTYRSGYNTPGATLPVADYIFGTHASSETIEQRILVNGEDLTTAENSNHSIVTDADYTVGGTDNSSSGSYVDGRISEVISYSGTLSDADRRKVNTYLAIKYGMTILGDYVSSNGTTIWTSAGGYDNAIAGIGQDVSSGLLQKQSRSTSYTDLAIGLGTLAESNPANTSSFAANNSFMIWGHNGAALDFVNPLVDDFSYASRIWNVQETGSVGMVQVRMPRNTLRGTNPELVRSTDPSITSADDRIPMTVQGDFLVATIDFANGDYFTFAQEPPPAPGGVVPNLALWLRSDLGVTSDGTTTWADQSGNGNDASQTSTTQPAYVTTGDRQVNFNPTLDFTSDFLRGDAGLHTNEIIVVATPNNGFDDNAPDQNFIGWNNSIQSYFGLGNLTSLFTGEIISFGTGTTGNNRYRSAYGDVTAVFPAKTYLFGTFVGSGIYSQDLTFDGAIVTSNQLNNFRIDIDNDYTIAALDNGSATSRFDGRISEVISYSSTLSTADRSKVYSYLAIKYGITLDPSLTSYVATDGSTVWNNTTYWNNVTAIGRDDATGLNQRQSRSDGAEALVSIGLGEIAATNGDNANAFVGNLNFLAFGDDNGTLGWTSTGAPPTPTGYEVVGRTYFVQESGTIGPVSISVSDNSSTNAATLPDEGTFAVSLLVDDDGDFTSGATILPMTLNGTEWVTDQAVDLSNGQFFTFARRFEINATVEANQVTCDMVTLLPNMDANISLTAADGVVTAVGFSEGTVYTGPDFSGATPVSNPSSGVTVVGGLANPDFTIFYTVRAFASASIFEDYVVALEPKSCTTADLSVTVSTTDDEANVGELLVYDVTLNNSGPDPAVNVQVRVDIPAGLDFVTASSPIGEYSPGTQLWTIPQVPVNNPVVLQVTYRMK
ncbi:MAG: DUF11 domain-containing protein [Bacteroidota bacterium]